jgi:hypothetical protein
MNIFSQRSVSNIALVVAFLCVLLMMVRSFYAVSFTIPLQLVTSGAEYESLYVIWKYINGLTVYADHNLIPFAGSFYNWLYYLFYGEISGALLEYLSLEDAWLPTMTRLITLTGTIYGVWITTRLFWSIPQVSNGFLKKLALAFATLIFLGPLVGFFGIATQPDIWGFAFDVTAIYLFLHFYKRRPFIGVVLFCIFAYLAWSFKQIFVFSTGAVGLFLLLRQDWRMLGVITFLSWFGWGITLGLGSPQYIKTVILFGGSTVALDSAHLIKNLSNLLIKIIPVLLGLFGALLAINFNSKLKNLFKEIWSSLTKNVCNPHIGLSLIGCVVTGIIVIPASAKLLSAENYYFMLSFYLSFFLLSILSCAKETIDWPALISWPLGLGWLLQGVAICLVLVGTNGIVSKRHVHEFNSRMQLCLNAKNLRQPLFVADQYLSLPWMIPAKEHFVIQTNYRFDKPLGIAMEGGGVGGLIDKGYFASIAIVGNNFDGSNLRQYRNRNEKCGAFTIFDRINTNSN